MDLVDSVLEKHFCVHPQYRFGKWAKAQCLVCVCVCMCVHLCACAHACARAYISVCGVVINFREPAHCFLQGTDHRQLLRNGSQNNHCMSLFLPMSSRFFFKLFT